MSTPDLSKTSPAADGKSRQAALRERRAAEGLVRVELWALPEERAALLAFADALALRRKPKGP